MDMGELSALLLNRQGNDDSPSKSEVDSTDAAPGFNSGSRVCVLQLQPNPSRRRLSPRLGERVPLGERALVAPARPRRTGEGYQAPRSAARPHPAAESPSPSG